jgi:hypothetical protein
MNNFQELEAKRLKEVGRPPVNARKNILHRMGTYHLISDFVELYIPRVFGFFIGLLGGEEDNENPRINKSKYPNKQ